MKLSKIKLFCKGFSIAAGGIISVIGLIALVCWLATQWAQFARHSSDNDGIQFMIAISPMVVLVSVLIGVAYAADPKPKPLNKRC